MNDNSMPENGYTQHHFGQRINHSSDLDLMPGDCGLILKADGAIQTFLSGDTALDAQRSENTYSPAERDLIDNARKLAALIIALQNPQVMALLYNVAAELEVPLFGA